MSLFCLNVVKIAITSSAEAAPLARAALPWDVGVAVMRPKVKLKRRKNTKREGEIILGVVGSTVAKSSGSLGLQLISFTLEQWIFFCPTLLLLPLHGD